MTAWPRPALACVLLALGAGACHPASAPATPTQAPSGGDTAGVDEKAQQAHAQELYDLGMGFARAGDSVRAEHYLNAAMEAGFAAERVLPELMAVCIRGGRLRSALGYAEPRLRSRPTDVGLRYLVGSLYLGLGRTKEGIRELQTVLTLAPKEARAHYLLAVTMAEQVQDEAGARQHFEAYLAVEPEGRYSPEARLWLRQHPVGGVSEVNTVPTRLVPQRIEAPHAAEGTSATGVTPIASAATPSPVLEKGTNVEVAP